MAAAGPCPAPATLAIASLPLKIASLIERGIASGVSIALTIGRDHKEMEEVICRSQLADPHPWLDRAFAAARAQNDDIDEQDPEKHAVERPELVGAHW